MLRQARRPVLFFDFDNTLTSGDVLDHVIEQFSPNDAWRDWEHAWETGGLSARDCLRQQVENLRVTRDVLFGYLGSVRVDPAFPAILDWATHWGIEINIVSDSFVPLIRHILDNNGIGDVQIFANHLAFSGDRLTPSFPFFDPRRLRSANAKASHLSLYKERWIVFAGDGHSDLDIALAADVRFAKDTLAKELAQAHVAFRPFDTLEPVLHYLRDEIGHRRVAGMQLV